MRRVLPTAATVGILLVTWATASASAAAPGRAWDARAGGPTGRLLVTLRAGTGAHAASAAVARVGGRAAQAALPQLRTLAVRATPGTGLRTLARRLRADPRVAAVRPERRFALRYLPGDPTFAQAEAGPPGTVAAWWALHANLPAAWDVARGNGARVAVIDTGIDGTHPEFAGKVLEAADFDDDPTHGGALTDEVGHGTHVASLACAAADNGLGLAGSGLGCKLLIAKSDLTELSVARSIIWAADRGADAINMSFGSDGALPAAEVVVQALHYAAEHGAVLVAAAADQPVEEQGDPANVLQPTGSSPNVAKGLGLSVTATDATDARAVFAGRGTQVSLAAPGTFGTGGQPGLLAAFPAQTTTLESGAPPLQGCRCRAQVAGDPRYAYLQGTSMASPIVAGVAAMMRALNPGLAPADVVRLLKVTARRPAGAWSSDVGWGLLDAGAALAAARDTDKSPPASKMRRAVLEGHSILLRWSGSDAAPPGVKATGVARYEVWRSTDGRRATRIRTLSAAHTRTRVQGRAGGRYAFYTRAIDAAGNTEPAPRAPDARVRVT